MTKVLLIVLAVLAYHHCTGNHTKLNTFTGSQVVDLKGFTLQIYNAPYNTYRRGDMTTHLTGSKRVSAPGVSRTVTPSFISKLSNNSVSTAPGHTTVTCMLSLYSLIYRKGKITCNLTILTV